MYAVGRLGSYIAAPFHPFGGAVDIIVVEQQDGSFKSSPWYVKFGKFQGVLKSKEKIVAICVNGVEADFHIYLDHKGEAYFLKEVENEEDPIVFSSYSSGDEADDKCTSGGMKKSKSCDFDLNLPASEAQINVGGAEVVARTNSRRSRILGFMFGGKSMKKDGSKSAGADDNVVRTSSFERAEIAADLLEVKWSTNLPTGKPRKINSSRLSASDTIAQETDMNLVVDNGEGKDTLVVHDKIECNENYFILPEATDPCSSKMSICSLHSSNDSPECSNRGSKISSQAPQDHQDVEMTSLHVSISQDVEEVSHQNTLVIEGCNGGNANLDEGKETCIEGTNFAFPQMAEPCAKYIVKDECKETDSLLRSASSREESGACCPESEKSSMDCAFPGDQNVVLQKFYERGSEEAVVDRALLCKESKLTPESKSITEENADGEPLGVSAPGEYLKTETVTGNKETLIDAGEERILGEFLSTSHVNSVNLDSTKSEILVVTSHEKRGEHDIEHNLGTETHGPFWNQSQMVSLVHSCASGISELGLQEQLNEPGSHFHRTGNKALGWIGKPDPQDTISNFIPLEEMQTLDEGNETNKLQTSDTFGNLEGLSVNDLPKEVDSASKSASDISEDNQFFLGDINELVPDTMQQKDSTSSRTLGIVEHLIVTQDEIARLDDTNELSASSVKLGHERFPKAFQFQGEETECSLNSLIPRVGTGLDKEKGLVIGSLPNIHSLFDNMGMSDVQRTRSHSLDLDSENTQLEEVKKSSLEFNSDTECQLVDDHSKCQEVQFFEEFKNLLTTNKVEISLSKHLMYKGMGTNAASQVFDAERVDLEKLISLGPSFVNNERLIARIGGHYYPWDAAQPTILGMISCEQEQILEPDHVEAVNRKVETQVVDSSKANDSDAKSTSSAGWKLWSFKSSKSTSPVKPGTDEAAVSEIQRVLESTNDVAEDRTELKDKVPWKKVKSIVPTSQQLASLKLNEGKNIITFTFSTAMLGTQQVDARIYLWKWNTLVVVSDVDGTITRSDVLGQFMPLVGRDWSQIGVTHLFSAIKENGYQLLFLSARSISQAYLTRQFLVNLNQDGKALPDGPVVISPDGLFPSLFREVIRRAPHEFKIACLMDIKALFPRDCNPFYAGFGNRDTDEFSYLKVGIPKGKIFIINAKGEVTVNRRTDRKSYTSLHALVHDMFPATSSSSEQEEFNSWNYWRTPLSGFST
ncbi:hypothetical protein Sjap_022404 [Stephania japonica]|uniref:phosphatidate phosphatase n=1 Tax=Stephania japonica TaxID=461633 RepID=A0AAP0ERY6_9MAGN